MAATFKKGRHKPPLPSPFAMSSNVMKRAGSRVTERERERKTKREPEPESGSGALRFTFITKHILYASKVSTSPSALPYSSLYGIYMYLLRLICGWSHISHMSVELLKS